MELNKQNLNQIPLEIEQKDVENSIDLSNNIIQDNKEEIPENTGNYINRTKENRLFENLRKLTKLIEKKSVSEEKVVNPSVKLEEINISLEKNNKTNAKIEEAFKIAEDFIRKSPNELIKNQDYLVDSTQKLAEINKKIINYYLFQQQVNLFTNLMKNGIMEHK